MLRTHFRIHRLECLEGRALLSTMMFETEPNNRIARADVATLDSSINPSVEIVGTARANDRDFFVVPILNSGSLSVTFQERGTANTALKIIDAISGRTLLSESARAGTRTETFKVTAGERLVIRVENLGHQLSAYAIDMMNTIMTPGFSISSATSPVGSNTSILRSIGFDSDGHALTTETLTDANDVHTWNFAAPKSGRLTVNANNSADPVVVQVLNATGQVQLTVFSNVPNFTSSTDLIAGHTYQIRVRPQSLTPASYTVSLTLV